jgi:hypothetical protein
VLIVIALLLLLLLLLSFFDDKVANVAPLFEKGLHLNRLPKLGSMLLIGEGC